MDTALPRRLTELSIHSLKQVNNPTFQPNMAEAPLQLKLTPIPLKPRKQETIVAAVDTSSIRIGETATGTLIAIRGATVYKQNRQYRYVRVGPFILHTTEENKHEVYAALQHSCFNTTHEHTPNLLQMPMRMANYLEKWLQATLARNTKDSLILFDGSLTSGTPDTPIRQLKETLATARQRRNTVLAFSKMTTLRFNGHPITDAQPNHKPPYLLETTGLKPKPPIVLLGDVYVARLTNGNYAFRVDIDKEVLFQEKIEAIEKLLTNDLIAQSYPETLRLAHILCTFTANEVIAIQHLAASKYGVKIIQKPDMHRLLFGPFGRGENNA